MDIEDFTLANLAFRLVRGMRRGVSSNGLSTLPTSQREDDQLDVASAAPLSLSGELW
ncbi:MAG: hypothetical protein ACRDQ0_10030 [Pseudonocardia sp.]